MADSNYRKERKKGMCVGAEGRNVEREFVSAKIFLFSSHYQYKIQKFTSKPSVNGWRKKTMKDYKNPSKKG